VSDLVQIQAGMPPWAPTASSKMLHEFDHWNRPTMGIIGQDGCAFLFSVLGNSDTELDPWLLIPIAEHEVEDLVSSDGSLLDGAVMALATTGRSFTVALADSDRIFASLVIHGDDVSALGDPLRAINAAMTRLRAVSAREGELFAVG